MTGDKTSSTDREILDELDCGWIDDPRFALESIELSRILEYFEVCDDVERAVLPHAIRRIFRRFVSQVLQERFREGREGLEPASKPSTIAARELMKLQVACENLEACLAGIDPAAEAFLDRYLETQGVTDEGGKTISFKSLAKLFAWRFDHLIFAAQLAGDQTSRGPANVAQRQMIESFANWWEVCTGELPTSDRGRGRRDDPFLDLCQEVTQIGPVPL
jgi:hypothetical protein